MVRKKAISRQKMQQPVKGAMFYGSGPRKRKFSRKAPSGFMAKKRQQLAIGVFQSRQMEGKHTEEKKNIDVTSTPEITFGQTASNSIQLNVPCIEGTSPTTHIGRRIKMKSIFIRWQGSLAPTSTGASPLRMLVVYDKQSNAAASPAASVVTVDNITSPMNLANNKRFIILMDESVSCVGTAGPQSWMVERFRKIDLDVEFNEANGGTFADVQTGLITAFFWQNGNILIASPGGNGFYSRIRFVDA